MPVLINISILDAKLILMLVATITLDRLMFFSLIFSPSFSFNTLSIFLHQLTIYFHIFYTFLFHFPFTYFLLLPYLSQIILLFFFSPLLLFLVSSPQPLPIFMFSPIILFLC
jgi:hypothetical protein